MAPGSGGAVPQRLDEFLAFGGVVDVEQNEQAPWGIAKRLRIARTSVRRLLEESRTRRRPVLARPRKAA